MNTRQIHSCSSFKQTCVPRSKYHLYQLAKRVRCIVFLVPVSEIWYGNNKSWSKKTHVQFLKLHVTPIPCKNLARRVKGSMETTKELLLNLQSRCFAIIVWNPLWGITNPYILTNRCTQHTTQLKERSGRDNFLRRKEADYKKLYPLNLVQ